MINGDMAKEEVATGDGPMDAAFKAIEKIIGTSFMLEDYSVHSVTSGKDAQGEVIVKLRKNDNIVVGRGLSTDIVEAGIKAYLNAVNKMLSGAVTQEEDTNAKKTDNF
jgi:2-isopropylmalate synthase